ncbi:uncharacterized protein LOC123205165 isoform X2 [Mangifera indica]|uniref:uncharacterized protein LOC123205165 isoform X2 n=1 Tax=Mangifera indica TaxID=29780 RepID=UPI001CFA1E3E|nr:uncharacterized protein LOC123205165 isoform X2 [Mangifera indica]
MVDVAGSIGRVVSPVLEVGKRLAAPIWHQFKYLYNYTTNFKILEKEVDKLKNTRDEIQRKVTAAERNVEEIKHDVNVWQKDVEKTITVAGQLIQEKANNPRCFKGLCPNFIIHYKQSKKAFKLKWDDIDPLFQQEKEFDRVSFPVNPPEIWLTSNDDYLAFESRNSIVKSVWEALNDENVYMVGVYGMGGTGKTTLVQEIGRKAEKDKLFEEIVFVEVTESPDTKKIQIVIADNLGLKFENESEMTKKIYLRMKDKNILLILDNIWEPLEFGKTIGIPFIADRGKNKLLFTTRNLDVLEKMDCSKNFKMGILNEEESWTLFTKTAGNAFQRCELSSLPNDICKECGGLPIVICTVAKALKNRSHPSDWKVALQELREPPKKFIGLLEKEHMKIALSYYYLRDDELKKTFLICSLMENNASILDLFKHVVCLDILEGVNLTMEDARNRLDKLIRDLKDTSLLLDGFKSGHFAMHEVVRVVAIKIAYVDHHVFTMGNDVEREWKDREKLKKCTKISLLGRSNIISQLWPNDLDCPNLEYFYMSNSSFEIPENFFTTMQKLRVLNLVKLQQSSLPSSIDLLINLQTLCLDHSKVEDISVIGKLKKLKVLSLNHSCIMEFPIELGQLTQLRFLDLSNCWKLKIIAPNVISQFSQLEEFYVKRCLIKWNNEELKELMLLSNLTSLELDINDNKMLPKDFFSRELKRFNISTGGGFFQYPKMVNKEEQWLRIFKWFFNSTVKLEELYVIKNVELLGLAESSDYENYIHEMPTMPLFNKKVIFTNLMALVLNNVSFGTIWDNQLSTSSYQNLTQMMLEGCNKITYVFPFSITKGLQQLQYLQIKSCEVLEKIIGEEGEKVVNSIFPQLTQLKLINLPKLIVFYLGIHALELPTLKNLCIYNCQKFTSRYPGFQDYNEEGEVHISDLRFLCLEHKINPNLEVLELRNGLSNISWKSQSKDLEISKDKLASIPVGLLQIFKSIKKLKLDSCAYRKIKSLSYVPNLEVLHVEFCHELLSLLPSSTSFQNLKVLTVSNCNGLVNLTTLSTIKSLVQLRELSISDCRMLIEIVEKEGDATSSSEIVFNNLKKLSFKRLESLTCFSSGNYFFSFSLFEEFIIEECPNMKTFSQGSLCTPKLLKINYGRRWNHTNNQWEKMEVEIEGNDLNKAIQRSYKKQNQDISLDLKLLTLKDDNSMEICYNQHPTSFYQNFTHLIFWKCESIKYAFPSSIAKSLHQLQQLKIQNCKVLEEIVAKEEANAIVKFIFPNVTLLKLEDLPELAAFYPEVHTSEWPKLKELVVRNCDKFTSKYLSFRENNEESELNILDPKSIFLEYEINSNLEVFELEDGVRKISWQSQTKTLNIYYDDSTNIPLGLLQRFYNLKELQLSDSQYKEIISISDLPNLEALHVSFCNRLMSLLSSSASFQNLKVLILFKCRGLIMKLITPAMARSLVQLREMVIKSCGMLTEIVENEGDATTEIVFNNLNKLLLKQLENLTCFCSGKYSFNFPSLEELIIKGCPNMKIFSKGILSTPKLHKILYEIEEVEIGRTDLNASIQQAHKEKVDSFSKELTLCGKDIMSISQGELQENFGKVLTLQLIKDEYAYIPIHILTKFTSLEELILKVNSYEEIFSCGEGEEYVGALAKLKVLKLQGLFNLKCIWKQEFHFKSILHNLQCLWVQYCHNLMTLLPSSSFENLKSLMVWHCNGMQNLMTSSTVKSLVCLESLSIEECGMMVEVLANKEDMEKGEIVFEKLKELSLFNLESLTCFFSGNYTLKFQFLESLHVRKCSKMKTFSREGLNMPRLEWVNWENCSTDLNLVTQQLQDDCSKLWERFP